MSFRNLLDQLAYFRDLHLKQPGWYSELLMRVMSGEGLKEIAAKYACHYSPLREFIREDDDRESEYQSVIEKKREMAGEELLDSTIAAARTSVQDARNGDGTDWLEVDHWPKGLLAAADTVEFSSDGRPFKIKADVGKSKDRLARMLGLEKSEANVNLSVSLVSVLSGMPAGAIRQRPGPQAVEDATYSAPKQVEKETDAGEAADTPPPAGNLLLDNPPRQAVRQQDYGI